MDDEINMLEMAEFKEFLTTLENLTTEEIENIILCDLAKMPKDAEKNRGGKKYVTTHIYCLTRMPNSLQVDFWTYDNKEEFMANKFADCITECYKLETGKLGYDQVQDINKAGGFATIISSSSNYMLTDYTAFIKEHAE
jgi:hypothetical protein